MFFLQIPTTAVEITVFVLLITFVVFAVRFVLASRKEMEELVRQDYAQFLPPDEPKAGVRFFPSLNKKHQQKKEPRRADRDIQKMQSMILQQQEQLSAVVNQLKGLDREKTLTVEALPNRKVEDLQLSLDKKDAEIRSLRQQNELANKMQVHFDELQKEFDVLQEKLEKVELQAWQANELAMKVENLEQANIHLEKELLRKDEKLSELAEENQRLNSLLHQSEDKLQESNNQRQQLAKKVQFLQDINNDLKQLSDTNRKLQNEIRRIGELESMLNLIMQERDELLRRVHH